jgi:hypothetical protein
LKRDLSFFGFAHPGNDVMCSIVSLFVDTLIYGFVIIAVVMTMMFAALDLFCVDDPNRTENYIKSEASNTTYYMLGIIPIENRPFIHRVSFPKYFTKRAESLLDICFLVVPTLVVIMILIPTLGFLYNNEYRLENISTALSIDVIGHQ